MLHYRSFIIFFWLVFSTAAFAKDICDATRNTTPLPDWWAQTCGSGGGNLQAKIGGAFSSVSDTFNLNPAAIPTFPTPVGIEVISSASTSGEASKTNIGLIKGLKNVGAAVSTDSDDTFYSNMTTPTNFGTGFQAYTKALNPGAVAPSINLGSALSLDSVLTAAPALTPNLGALLRYNKNTKTISPGFGFSLGSRYASLGASVVNEGRSATAPGTTFYTATLGFKPPWFQIEYIYIQNTSNYDNTYYSGSGSTYADFKVTNKPIHILSASTNIFGISLTGAMRKDTSSTASGGAQYHVSAQYQFNRFVAAGYLYNYIPGFQSLSLQLYF